jgi:hypothetical protein
MDMGRRMLMVLGALLLTVTACSTLMGRPEGDVSMDDLPDNVETAVREMVSQNTGVDVGDVEITEVSEKEWPNACLGLPEEDELCAEVITPGYEVRVEANGREYVIRTDLEGDAIRIEE